MQERVFIGGQVSKNFPVWTIRIRSNACGPEDTMPCAGKKGQAGAAFVVGA